MSKYNDIFIRQPLVSIIIISYNSSKYVLETLESAKAQTYQNIELIVTDDCSTDNTVEICRKWIDENKNRFSTTELITVSKNSGIPANCNRGVKSAHGDWVKIIAGDDLLLPDCIENLIGYSFKQPNAKVIFSRMQSFYIEDGGKKYSNISPYPKEELIFNYSANVQYNYLLTKSFNLAPASLIKTKVIEEIGGFEEKYTMIEDLPFWLKLTNSGIQLNFIPVITVLYRLHDKSLTSSISEFYNILFYKSYWKVKKDLIYPNVPFYKIIFWQSNLISYLKYYVAIKYFNNAKTARSEKVHHLLSYFDWRFTFYTLVGVLIKFTGKNKKNS